MIPLLSLAACDRPVSEPEPTADVDSGVPSQEEDCDDVWHPDRDGDGFGDPSTPVTGCDAPPDHVADGTDCDDGDADIRPGAELAAPAACALDADGDGFGAADPPDGVAPGADCDDGDATISPAATEVCFDAADNDCDGAAGDCAQPARLDLAEARSWISGRVFAGVGDLDADGADDVAVGCESCDQADIDAGSVHLVLGPIPGAVDPIDLDPASVAVLTGEARDDHAGSLVLGPGDVDGDAHPDLLVGAAEAGAGGAVYLALGPFAGERSLADAHTRWFGADGEAIGSLAATADVDGDAAVDFLIATNARSVGDSRGRAYLAYDTPPGTVALADAAGAVFEGAAANDFAGEDLALGDIDGDGLADVAIGATGAGSGGEAYLFLGSPRGHHTPADSDATLIGQVGDFAGSGLAIGDLDDDGYGDVLVGARENATVAPEAGAVYVVRGPFAGDLDLAAADATLLGEDREAHTGAVAIARGFGDTDESTIIVGAWGIERSYLVGADVQGVVSLSSARVVVAAARTGALAGDLDGDGAGDLLFHSVQSYQDRVVPLYGSGL